MRARARTHTNTVGRVKKKLRKKNRRSTIELVFLGSMTRLSARKVDADNIQYYCYTLRRAHVRTYNNNNNNIRRDGIFFTAFFVRFRPRSPGDAY